MLHRALNGAAAYGLASSVGPQDPMTLLRGTELFDIYTWPVVTRFGDVHNVRYDDLPLPPEIAQRLAGRTIAIRGIEGDWVSTDIALINNASTPSRESAVLTTTNIPAVVGADERVPPTSMYNHHMKFAFPNAKADNVEEWLFSEGNGGEMRASFKGFPAGTGLVVHSPQNISINLMAIDLDERISTGAFGAAPAVLSTKQAAMIECPCTRTRPDKFKNSCTLHEDRNMHHWLRKDGSCAPDSYQGGGRCCIDGTVLLENNETQPVGQLARRFRMRFYYDAYQPATPTQAASHEYLSKMTVTPEGKAVEYTVPACSRAAKLHDASCYAPPTMRPMTTAACAWPPLAGADAFEEEEKERVEKLPQEARGWTRAAGTDGCNFTLHFKIQTKFALDVPPHLKAREVINADGSAHGGPMGYNATLSLVYAIPHCHAPSCKLVELYDADDNLLCRVTPKYNHAEYIIRIDPCVWGSPEEGLSPRPVLPLFGPKAYLKMIKVNHNRLGRPLSGEMGSWQIRAVLDPKSPRYRPNFVKGWHAWST